MSPNEREQLQQFLNQLKQAKLSQKDSDADQLILDAVAHQPDAPYLLVQRSLLLEQALHNAKLQISELQKNQPAQTASFLGNDPWAQAPSQTANYQPPRPTAPLAANNNSWLGGSGFMGNLASTAAGVVAGSFLFQGIENLMGHHNYGGWQNNPSGLGEHLNEQTIVNNYYGDDAIHDAGFTPDTADYDSGNSDFDTGNDSDSDWI